MKYLFKAFKCVLGWQLLSVVFAQVKAEGAILPLKPKKDSNQLHHPLSPLQSKSKRPPPQCPVPLSLPPLICFHFPLPLSLKASSSSLYLQYSLSLSFIYFCPHCLFVVHCIFYSHITLFPAHCLTFARSSFSAVIFYLLFQTVGFSGGVGKIEKVSVEINGACISLASPPLQIGFLLPSAVTPMHNSSLPPCL